MKLIKEKKLDLITIMTELIKNLAYNLRFTFSAPKRTIVNIFRNGIANIGGMYTLVTVADAIQIRYKFLEMFAAHFLEICFLAVILSLTYSVDWISRFTCKLDDYDIKISLEVGDILKKEKSLIISTNTSFATTLDHGIISLTSVQGAFQNRYYQNNLKCFDKLIKNALATATPTNHSLSMFKKDYPIYKIGTTAVCKQNNRWVYMVALNDLNEYGQNASRDIDDLYVALNGLWTTICEKGHIESELSIPLIASGKAGMADATKETVIQAIIDTFLITVCNSRCKITEHLKIVIFPPDLERIDVQKMKEFLKYRCAFTKKPSNSGIGVSLA